MPPSRKSRARNADPQAGPHCRQGPFRWGFLLLPAAAENPLTRAAARAFLEANTFKLRPADYAQKYPKWQGSVGLEIEMLPVMAPAPGLDYPRHVTLQGREHSIAAILRAYAQERGFKLEDTEDDHGRPLLLRVLLDEDDNFSFEPGGQVEFSSKPYPCLSDAVKRMRTMQATLDKLFAPHGISLTQVGINPWHTLAEIGLQMPKGRYRAMDRYFSRLGPYGQRMMRQTCTVQVNLDFGPTEATLARRYLASMLLAPIAGATFANSPVVDRETSTARGFRCRVWRHVDNTRTGLPGLDRVARELTRAACIDTYLEFAMAAGLVFVAGHDYAVPDSGITFSDWVDKPLYNLKPGLDDFKTHMSLLFPEVRPRGFLELRSIDCQPRAFQTAPAAYMTGLLYDDQALDRLIELLLPLKDEIPGLLAEAEHGLAHPLLATLSKQVMALADEGFNRLAPCFVEGGTARELATFRAHFTERGRTPADDIIDQLTQDKTPYLRLSSLRLLEERWEGLKR